MADYEKVSKQGDTKVASFDEDENTPLRRLQHFLHSNPTAIPVIVLLLGVILFTIIAGGKFLPSLQSLADPAAGDDHRRSWR